MTAIHVSRNGKTLGIYPEPDARDYYAQGRIAPHDLVWREGMAGWVAASELFGPAPQAAAEPIAPPVPPPMPAALSARQVPTFETNAPLPPKLHWTLVLLFTLLTFGLFVIVWLFIQAAWVKKIDPRSRALTMMAIYLALVVVGQAISAASEKESAEAAAGGMLVLIGSVVAVVGMFSMRRSMIDYYNSVEPIGLKLSAALTFFFGLFYLQYHMTRIAKWKQGGVLPLQ
jgi:uncharacterized membrane protein